MFFVGYILLQMVVFFTSYALKRVFNCVTDGYENLGLKRTSTDKADTPYAQLNVADYEELPDRNVTAVLPPTQALDEYENVTNNRVCSSSDTPSTDVQTDPYENISER